MNEERIETGVVETEKGNGLSKVIIGTLGIAVGAGAMAIGSFFKNKFKKKKELEDFDDFLDEDFEEVVETEKENE